MTFANFPCLTFILQKYHPAAHIITINHIFIVTLGRNTQLVFLVTFLMDSNHSRVRIQGCQHNYLAGIYPYEPLLTRFLFSLLHLNNRSIDRYEFMVITSFRRCAFQIVGVLCIL